MFSVIKFFIKNDFSQYKYFLNENTFYKNVCYNRNFSNNKKYLIK